MAQAETTSRIGVGTLIADTYEIKRLLGRGGMGTVWEATHARLPGKKVAIKVLHPEVAKDTESLARFRREAEIASRIGHPNIVDVHDFNELADGTPYLILEYLEGISLEDRVQRGAMPLPEVVSLARQIGSALRAAHAEGVIHRDLKPQNIFLARTTDAAGNETYRARVLDFGISKIRGSSTVQTQDSTILGTPQYMAPEQATGAHSSVDQRTDVFALGAMVYEMLAGKPAFDGQTIPEVVFKVVYEQATPLDQLCAAPPQVIRAVHQALEKKQEDRFQSVESFIESLSGTALSMRGAPVPAAVHGAANAGANPALASTVASGNHPAVPGLAQTGQQANEQQANQQLGVAATIDSGRMSPDSLGLPVQATHHAGTASSGMAPPVGPASQNTHGATHGASHGAAMATAAPANAGDSVARGNVKAGAGGLKVALALTTIIALGGAGVAFWALTRNGNDNDNGNGNNSDQVASNSDDVNVNAAAVADAAPIVELDGAPVTSGVDTDVSDDSDAAEKLKAEKLAAEKLKAEKLAAEKLKAEKLAAEKLKAEKLKAEKLDNDDDDTDVVANVVTRPPVGADPGADDPEKDYQEARRLLHSDPRQAIKLIRRALGNGKKSARYYTVKAYAHCKLRDLTRLNSTLAKIKGASAKATVKKQCKVYWPDYDG